MTQDRESTLQQEFDRAEEEKRARDQDILSSLPEAREKAEAEKGQYEQLLLRIQTLEDALQRREQTVLKRLVNFFEIQRMRRQLESARESLSERERQYEEAQELVMQMEYQVLDRTTVATLESQVWEARMQKQEAFEAREADKKVRDVREIMKEHHVIFAHGFAANDQSPAVSVMAKGATWKERLNVILGLQPEIATSTVRDQQPTDEVYYRMGVLLGGGSVSQVSASDAGTHVQGLERLPSLAIKEPEPIEKQITSAVLKETKSYNEISVREPSVAGLYLDHTLLSPTAFTVAAEVYGTSLEEIRHYVSDFLSYAEDLGAPVFMRVSDGRFYSMTRSENGEIVIGEQADSEAILERGAVITEEQKRKAREDIFENAPFKLRMPERRAFDAWKAAAEVFQTLAAQRAEGGDDFETDRFIHFGWTMRSAEQPVINIETCLESLRSLWQKETTRLDEEIADYGQQIQYGRETNVHGVQFSRLFAFAEESKQQLRLDVGLYAHRFAELAQETGQTEWAQQAREIAIPVLSQQEYQSFVKRRVGKGGGFRITEEDLQYIHS